MAAKLKALVVDDDPAIRSATVRIAATAGFTVLEAGTGEDGLAVVSSASPDLVLLDVVLPGMDGYEVCRRLKSSQQDPVPYVVMVSGGRTTSDEQSRGLERGADGYIARPLSNRELKARIEAWGRIIRAERERDRLIEDLKVALAKIESLQGLLPICSSCKRIRNDEGAWTQVELYVQRRSRATFTHGICPECHDELYPDFPSRPDHDGPSHP